MFYVQIKHGIRKECLEKPSGKGSLNQPMGPAVLVECTKTPILRQMFVMSGQREGFVATDESVCLDSPDKDTTSPLPRVKVMACSGQKRQQWRYHPGVNEHYKHRGFINIVETLPD